MQFFIDLLANLKPQSSKLDFRFSIFDSRKNGFTLIELIVTVTIMLAVTGIGIAGYIRFNDRQMVVTAAKDLQTFLRTSQSKASSRTIDPGANCGANTSNGPYQGNMVVASSGLGATVTSGANCGCLQGTTCGAGVSFLGNTAGDRRGSLDSLKLPASVQLESSFILRFWGLYGGTQEISMSPTSGMIILSKGPHRYAFEVTAGGEISEGRWL